MKKFYIYVLAVWILLLSPAVYYAVKQSGENSQLSSYLKSAQLNPESGAWQNAIKLSQKLRAEFVVDESSFKKLEMSNRPFLRESSAQLLTIKEGQCGEGTRVLVNLLLEAGYDATRVSLYDSFLNSSHTLVSLIDGGQEYFIDSINTQAVMNAYMNTHQINAKRFQVVKYQDDVTLRSAETAEFQRHSQLETPLESEVESRFFNRFKYYSYEAVPLTKLMSLTGLDLRVLNFKRPPPFISSLAEKPNQIMAIFWILLSTATAVLLVAAKWVSGKRTYNDN